MDRRQTTMHQQDHDLLIEIRTKLEALIQSSRDQSIATSTALAAKADLTDFTQFKAATETTLTHHAAKLSEFQRVVWVGIGAVLILQLFFMVLRYLPLQFVQHIARQP